MPSSKLDANSALSWPQKMLLLAFGFALIGALEVGLRMIGLGDRPPLLRPLSERTAESAASGYFQINPSLADPFFGNTSSNGENLLGGHRGQLVQLPKSSGTIRVLFVGGSTVEGFPLPRNLTAAAFLELFLQRALPDYHVEVVNLGVTAVASFAVREIALQALEQLDPDLLIVYTGHNEFFGAAGLESHQKMGNSVAAMRVVYWLRATALYQAGVALFPREQSRGNTPSQLIDIMAGVDQVEPAGESHRVAGTILEANIVAIIRGAKRFSVPVVVSTVASNERHLAPLASWEGPEAETQKVSLQEAVESLRLRLPQEARIVVKDLEAFTVADPLHAGAAFAHAQALDALAQSDQAWQQYQKARDLDAMPWRATSDKNEILRKVTSREGVPLVDSAAAFSKASGGSPGWDLFFDHLHPNLRGQALLAQTIFGSIREHSLLPLRTEHIGAETDWRRAAQKLGANKLEYFLLSGKMAKFFRDSPIGNNNPGAIERFDRSARLLEKQFDPAEMDAIDRWRRASERAGRYLPISWFGGVSALASGDLFRAVGFFDSARRSAYALSDERAAAGLLQLLSLVELDRANAPAVHQERLAEAEVLVASDFRSSAVKLRVFAGLLALSGNRERALEIDVQALNSSRTLSPIERVYWEPLPTAAAIRRLAPRR